MESFNIIKPSPLLAPYVRYYWILRVCDVPEVSERVIASGSINLIFHRGGKMFSSADNDFQPRSFVSGLSTKYTDLSSLQAVDMIVVVFQPFGAGAFFKMPVNEFHEKSISINLIGDKSLVELEDKLFYQTDDRACIDLIEKFLINRLLSIKDYNYKRIVASINAINNDPVVSIKSLADISCLSYKQFNRIFTGYIGSNPKEFMRIVRFQRALFIMQHNDNISMTSLALECGYYDQSHLVKEFKSFSGYTPTEYISVCPPHSDYFSVI